MKIGPDHLGQRQRPAINGDNGLSPVCHWPLFAHRSRLPDCWSSCARATITIEPLVVLFRPLHLLLIFFMINAASLFLFPLSLYRMPSCRILPSLLVVSFYLILWPFIEVPCLRLQLPDRPFTRRAIAFAVCLFAWICCRMLLDLLFCGYYILQYFVPFTLFSPLRVCAPRRSNLSVFRFFPIVDLLANQFTKERQWECCALIPLLEWLVSSFLCLNQAEVIQFGCLLLARSAMQSRHASQPKYGQIWCAIWLAAEGPAVKWRMASSAVASSIPAHHRPLICYCNQIVLSPWNGPSTCSTAISLIYATLPSSVCELFTCPFRPVIPLNSKLLINTLFPSDSFS